MTRTDAPNWTRLGVIAGGGRLPVLLAKAEQDAGRVPFVVRLNGFTDDPFDGHENRDFNLGAVGGIQDALKAAGCDAICFAGTVKRPDFKTLRPADMVAAKLLPSVVAAGMKGDDALLRVILQSFEKAGFKVVGADDVLGELISKPGGFGALNPTEAELADARKALKVAREIGRLDIGQGAVVCDGLVLAVEAQEGTDSMLARIAALPADIRGSSVERRGVLAKAPKPIQERRMDLPVIGVSTLENAFAAGLAGIAVEAGGALIVDRLAITKAADEFGLFVMAIDPELQ